MSRRFYELIAALKGQDSAGIIRAAEGLEDLRNVISRRDQILFQIPAGQRLYRARTEVIQDHENHMIIPISLSEIGAPPERDATAGRFNGKGQRVLYTATGVDIALAEVKPASAECCTVGVFQTDRIVNVANCLPVQPNEYLLHAGADDDAAFWFALCRYVSAQPSFANIEGHYRSCRIIASVFSEVGAEGLLYQSAFWNPHWDENDVSKSFANIVFFDPDLATAVEAGAFQLNWTRPVVNTLQGFR